MSKDDNHQIHYIKNGSSGKAEHQKYDGFTFFGDYSNYKVSYSKELNTLKIINTNKNDDLILHNNYCLLLDDNNSKDVWSNNMFRIRPIDIYLEQKYNTIETFKKVDWNRFPKEWEFVKELHETVYLAILQNHKHLEYFLKLYKCLRKYFETLK